MAKQPKFGLAPGAGGDVPKFGLAPGAGGDVPLPKADPRSWAERLPRYGQSQDPGIGRETIHPGLVLDAKGINPSRKQGDAIDYHSDQNFAPPKQQDI